MNARTTAAVKREREENNDESLQPATKKSRVLNNRESAQLSRARKKETEAALRAEIKQQKVLIEKLTSSDAMRQLIATIELQNIELNAYKTLRENWHREKNQLQEENKKLTAIINKEEQAASSQLLDSMNILQSSIEELNNNIKTQQVGIINASNKSYAQGTKVGLLPGSFFSQSPAPSKSATQLTSTSSAQLLATTEFSLPTSSEDPTFNYDFDMF